MEQALQIAFTVWNAVVFETVNGDTRYVEMIRDLTAGEQESVALIVRAKRS